MINRSKKYIFHVYAASILSAIFFMYPPPLFANQLNDGKKAFFRVLSTQIPQTKNIVYISENYDDTSIIGSKPVTTIKAMKDDGTDSVSIIESDSILSIQISPDKRKLLLISPDHSPGKDDGTDWLNSHIWLYSKGKFKQLTNGKVMDSDAIWSQSGDKIYFTRSKIFSDVISGMLTATEGNVWVMNADGSKPLQLTSSKKNVVNITPAPLKDSKKILFTTNRNKKWQMFIMDNDGSNQKLFIDNGMLGRWSPNGEFLAFMDSSPGDIYLASKDGKLIKRLTRGGDINFSPAWSPDNQYLTYSRINKKSPENKNTTTYTPKGFLLKEAFSDIWKLSVNKQDHPKRLTYKGLNNNFPQWITTAKY